MGLLEQRGEYLIYLRKSRSDSPDASVEEVLAKHERMLQDYFRRELGHEIPEENIYREIVSGGESIEERPEMCKMLARIEDENILGCAVADPQRLSRGSLTDCDLLIDKFRFTKTLVITPVMVYDLENKMHRRLFQDELMRGRDYLDYVKTVLYTGRIQSAMKGNYVNSQPPYAYNKIKVGKEWTLEPNENADIVRMIFNWYAKDNKTPGWIASELDRLMIQPPKGERWKKESVLVMLKNVHYDGKIIYFRKKQTTVFENGKKTVKRLKQQPEDRIIVDGKHPAIVDHDLFELAQERIEGRGYLAPKTRRPLSNPLSGLLRCPICGYAMVYHMSGGGDIRFNCQRFCSKSVQYKDIVKGIKTALQTIHLPELQTKLDNGDGDSYNIQRQLITRLEKQLADLKARETKLFDLLETGVYSNEMFIARHAAVKEQITLTASQLAEAKKNLPTPVDYGEKIITLQGAIDAIDDDTIPMEKKNVLLKSIIKSVEYTSPKDQPLGVNKYTLEITLNI